MGKYIAFVLMLSLGSCLSNIPYSFSAAANSTSQQPSYSLGYINQDSTATIILSMPFGGSTSSVTLSIMDSTNTNVVQALSACSGTPCTVNWRATTSGQFYLKAAPASLSYSRFITYYIIATVDNRIALRVTDVLRANIVKIFYSLQAQTATFTLTPVADTATAYISLYSLTSANAQSPSSGGPVSLTTTTSGSIASYEATLARGYYAIVVTMVTVATARVTIQSDSYPCPYASSYSDIYNVFAGCSANSPSTSTSGFPCIDYDNDALICRTCFQGYTMVQGSCFVNNNCGERQYFSMGTCYNVNPACDRFENFSGNCLSCLNSTLILSNGQCVPNTCPSGTTLRNGICVSSTCGTFSATTGECFTCVTSAYFLTAGQCLPINCGTGLYYSVNASRCINVPANCLDFSITFENCSSCAQGSFLSQGTCMQLPNMNNCQIYNFSSSSCAQCNNGFYVLGGACVSNPICGAGQTSFNGICILTPSNCLSNQVFVNGQCVFLPDNCLSINIFYQCMQCAPNHQISSGVCRRCVGGSNPNFPCLTCPVGTFANSAGICQQANQFCASFSSTNGQCLSCSNGQPPVNGNCCDTGFVYQDNKCTKASTGGSGSSSDNSDNRSKYGRFCATIDPKLKICTSCLGGRPFDANGACN